MTKRFENWKLETGYYLEFGIWNLSFMNPTFRLCHLNFSFKTYLIFSVLMAIRPRIMPMIQNRTIIFGSAQPFNSKWW
jgi:hypothetical protein